MVVVGTFEEWERGEKKDKSVILVSPRGMQIEIMWYVKKWPKPKYPNLGPSSNRDFLRANETFRPKRCQPKKQ